MKCRKLWSLDGEKQEAFGVNLMLLEILQKLVYAVMLVYMCIHILKHVGANLAKIYILDQ